MPMNCVSVLSLPKGPAAITIFLFAYIRRKPLITNSRDMVISVAIGESRPTAVSIIIAAAERILSAMGSISLPKSVTIFMRRAICPSSISVRYAITNRAPARYMLQLTGI